MQLEGGVMGRTPAEKKEGREVWGLFMEVGARERSYEG